MNPQPAPFVGNIFAAMIILAIVYHFVKAFHDPSRHIHLKDMDLLTVGYVENSPVYVINNKKNPFTSTQLFKDCVDALGALGMKKTEAKNIATRIFNESIPVDVQEFLVKALRRE